MFHKEYNVEGYDKKEVEKILKAAKAKVKQDDLAAKAEELNEIQQIQDTYSK